MSVKVNLLLVAVAASLDATIGAPVVESLLDNVAVSNVRAVEVDERGRCVVVVEMSDGNGGTVQRPVATVGGDVKLFADGAAVVAMAKRSTLPGGQTVTIIKRAASGTVGDPKTALKTKHKAAVREAASAAKQSADLTSTIAAAQGMGWDVAPAGSAEGVEYADLQARKVAVTEWKGVIDASVTALAAALTAAGIDPVTYLPI